MHTTIRNVLAVVAGFIGGSVVNFALIMLSPYLIPPPEGVDVMSAESIRANLDLFRPINFLFPFLAHALGTLAGAVLAGLIAASRRTVIVYVMGGMFLLGGISAVLTIPAPGWFVAVDLLLAYLPMAWLATLLLRLKPDAT